MRCTVKEIAYKIPISKCGPGDSREKTTRIVTRRGYLMENRLLRLLRWEASTRGNTPEDRCEVDVPDEIVYLLSELSHKRSRSMGRMSDALDSRAEEICNLRTLTNMLLGVLLDLLDSAKDVRNELTTEGGSVTEKTFGEFCKEIDDIDEMIVLAFTPKEESGETEEEEKDD